MHILLGTLVGGGFAALTVIAFALVRGKEPVWQHVALAAIGGAVAGAVTTATLGAGGTAAAGIGREVVAFAVGGGSGGAAERVAENAMEGNALDEGVVTAAGVGAGFGLVSLGAAKGFQAGLTRFFPSRANAPPPKTFLRKLIATKTTGTGGSWLRGARAPGAGRGLRRAIDEERDAAASEPGLAASGEPDVLHLGRPLGAPARASRAGLPPPALVNSETPVSAGASAAFASAGASPTAIDSTAAASTAAASTAAASTAAASTAAASTAADPPRAGLVESLSGLAR